MGTDIHGFLQVKCGNRWENKCEIEDDRNYLSFAILAGVRNGFGFAGVKTHTPINPISEPRGLPDDLGFKDRSYAEFDDPAITNPQSREVPYEDFDFGDHSKSWLYMSEILDWPHWEDSVQMQGYVDRTEWEAMTTEFRNPNNWCGGISGPDVVLTTTSDVVAGTAPDGWTYALHNWEVKISDRARVFRKWLDYIEAKWAWKIERDPKSVRLVFGFDS